jgi:enoyl-CoA hydratase/carnithine racemase
MTTQTIDSKLPAPDVICEVHGQVGLLTLNRPQALNALSLAMLRTLMQQLLVWQDDTSVKAVAIRGMGKTGPFGVFCAGGDIRYFHQVALQDSSELDVYFAEEYRLNHLIHNYPKPYIAFMDGVVLGGGMGISQGAQVRVVTERTKMAMPETNIGLFPDVGGGYFLSRCPGHVGEWLALTGENMGVGDALEFGLADTCFNSAKLASAWQALGSIRFDRSNASDAIEQWTTMFSIATPAALTRATGLIDHYFSMNTVPDIVRALEADASPWAQHTAATLRRRSPLMLHVTLAQIRRARDLALADDLRMAYDLMHHCFKPVHLGRTTQQSEAVEGIRALAIDKDFAPQWQPSRLEDVSEAMVAPFFVSPWSPEEHPLRDLT